MLFHTHEIVGNSFLHSFLRNSAPDLLYSGHSHVILLSAVLLNLCVRHSTNLGALTSVRGPTQLQGGGCLKSCWSEQGRGLFVLSESHAFLSVRVSLREGEARCALGASCIWGSSLCTQEESAFPTGYGVAVIHH